MSRSLSLILAAVDETATLGRVLEEARALRPAEVILVANGTSEEVARIGREAGARVLRYESRVGYDVGRALGAAAATGDVLLFTDADLPLPGDALYPFCADILAGADVSLNRVDAYMHPAARLHPVNSAKRFLNAVLGRPDLGCASLTAVPHALSRRAVAQLGAAALAVPPRAQAQAVLGGLRVRAEHAVNVLSPNAQRPGLNTGPSSPVEQLILGDHLAAIHAVLESCGDARGGFSDLGRRLDLLAGIEPTVPKRAQE